MIDHVGFPVSDYERSKAFYLEALAPLDYSLVMEVTQEQHGHDPAAGFGANGKPDFWIGGEGGLDKPLHVAIPGATFRPWTNWSSRWVSAFQTTRMAWSRNLVGSSRSQRSRGSNTCPSPSTTGTPGNGRPALAVFFRFIVPSFSVDKIQSLSLYRSVKPVKQPMGDAEPPPCGSTRSGRPE